MTNIEIINPGLATTIQDLGRIGHQAQGIPVSGAIDQYAHRLANLLVNNSEKAATLEFSILGPTIKFFADTFIAVTGADSSPMLNKLKINLNTTYSITKGDVLHFSPMSKGRFGYISFANNGIQVAPVLDSRSTNTRVKLGGYHGRLLIAGDNLKINECYTMPSLTNRIAEEQTLTNNIIHFIKGPQWSLFSENAKKAFQNEAFKISAQADRMGFRLDGPTLEIPQKNMLSEGTVLGNVQITRAGQPIVLLADRQTAGGYPVIATIAATDLSKFVQFASNTPLFFKEISIEDATTKLREKYHFLDNFADTIFKKRYQYPIGPIRKASKKIEKLLTNNQRSVM